MGRLRSYGSVKLSCATEIFETQHFSCCVRVALGIFMTVK